VKGQSSMEFLAMISMSMIILAVLYGLMTSKQVDTFEQRAQTNAETVATDIGFNVEMALVQGEGYSRVLALPSAISGESYSVNMTNRRTILEYGDQTVSEPTRYPRQIYFEVNDSSNEFKVENVGEEVRIVEQ